MLCNIEAYLESIREESTVQSVNLSGNLNCLQEIEILSSFGGFGCCLVKEKLSNRQIAMCLYCTTERVPQIFAAKN